MDNAVCAADMSEDALDASFDAVIVGGGPAGATVADDLARRGRNVLLLERAGRIKPCGGAVPPRLLRDFEIPESLLVARSTTARVISPSLRKVDMAINGFVGMVDREDFDEWLRARAERSGATRRTGTFERLSRDSEGRPLVHCVERDAQGATRRRAYRAQAVVGADGANSQVGKQCVKGADEIPFVAAYHEVIESPEGRESNFAPERCEVYFKGEVSPDFYGWVFPHGGQTSVGVGSARKGFPLRRATTELRQLTGLAEQSTVRREGAPIPLRALKRWDNGRDVILAGDAAGVVSPASGEGIYYAMISGRYVADAVDEFCRTGEPQALAAARKRFKRKNGRTFWILGIMQRFWYSSDARRERFVSICRDPNVQELTWTAYMNKELVRAKPMAHVKIFFKDLAHLFGLLRP